MKRSPPPDMLASCLFYATLLAAALLASALLTGIMRRYAIAAQLLDRPNERSSHVVPTPRGGGVAIVLAALGTFGVLRTRGHGADGLVGALALAGGIVAVIGFLDDHMHLPVRLRFLAHVACSTGVLWLMGDIPPVPILGLTVDLGPVGPVLAVIYLVWMINLYNFMDGIDGIASIEAVTVCCGGALTWWLASGSHDWILAVGFGFCVCGFLLWNYPPAKIFMGDAGSGFIGLVVGTFSLWTATDVPQVFWCWFILTGCFMVDATTTLLRRVHRGERFYEAHRSHAYQHASRVHGSHKAVSLGVCAINVAWLLPWAILVALGKLDGVAGALIAYVPLVWLAYRYKAGDRAAQATLEAPRK